MRRVIMNSFNHKQELHRTVYQKDGNDIINVVNPDVEFDITAEKPVIQKRVLDYFVDEITIPFLYKDEKTDRILCGKFTPQEGDTVIYSVIVGNNNPLKFTMSDYFLINNIDIYSKFKDFKYLDTHTKSVIMKYKEPNRDITIQVIKLKFKDSYPESKYSIIIEISTMYDGIGRAIITYEWTDVSMDADIEGLNDILNTAMNEEGDLKEDIFEYDPKSIDVDYVIDNVVPSNVVLTVYSPAYTINYSTHYKTWNRQYVNNYYKVSEVNTIRSTSIFKTYEDRVATDEINDTVCRAKLKSAKEIKALIALMTNSGNSRCPARIILDKLKEDS